MPTTDLSTADPHLLWLDKPAPRYTSYPTANLFDESASPHDYQMTLRALPQDEAVSLYLHIPFCRSLCLYCGCHTSVTHRQERLKHYLSALTQEMTLLARQWPNPRKISRIHFGGGTPNLLTRRQLQDVFAALRRRFDLSACQEIAMELDPRQVWDGQMEALAACGVTRISLGVQDFNPAVQRAVHREQPYALIERICNDARAVGLRAINFDMMYGLPVQTPESVAASAQQAARLKPNRIALFSYAHVPQLKPHQKALEALGIPTGQTRLVMEQAARQALESEGYVPIGMDHFALPEDSLASALTHQRLHRNFQGYTDDPCATLLGLGASAIGQTDEGFFQNAREEERWREHIESHALATVRGLPRTPEDHVRGAIIEALMCYMACDLQAVCQRYRYPLTGLADALEALKPFENSGLITRKDAKIALATPHRMAIRIVCQAFDAYKAPSGAVASRAA